MTTPYLPDDCIYYILKFLQNYRSTLFNCLLVNRFWCEVTVPLLYADPFCSPINKNHSSVISTLVLSFNRVEMKQLKVQLKLANINNIVINDEDKPLFEYPKYLETFDYLNVNYIISLWLKLIYLHRNQRNKLLDNLIPIFNRSILRQCNNIKQLNISLYSLFNENYKNCNIQTNLTKLNALHLLFNNKNVTNNEAIQEFLSNMTNICLNLRKLKISLPKIDNNSINTIIKEKLCSIIQKQNNLRIFKLLLASHLSFLNNILLSLEVQKHSLIVIEFENVNFSNISFKNFISLCNLKYLKFQNCTELSLDQCEVLKYASFKLEVLNFIYNKWNNNFIILPALMIKYLGSSLKELILTEPIKIPIIENISIYCQDLVTLEIEVRPNIDLLVFSYFKNLKIRTLNVNNGWRHVPSEVLINLANNLPISVKEISWCFFILSTKFLEFKKFLENCHDCLEIINLNRSIELELLVIILDYIERNNNNNLKFLGVIESTRVLNDDESKLLNQIKAKGVDMVKFYGKNKFNFLNYVDI